MGALACELTSTVAPGELLAFYQTQKHPTDASAEKLAEMIKRSACFVTARVEGKVVGIARGVSDGLRGYLTECKLDPAYQGPAAVTRVDGRVEHDEHGIAMMMARHVLQVLRDQGVERIDVLAYGTEVDFCEELGFRRDPTLVPMHLDTARTPGA